MNKQQPLALSKLTKEYGQFRGVDSIDLELKSGEVFGFLGPNGAGKTTVIRTILDFIRPSSGSVSVFGMDSVRDSLEIKKHVGYLAGDIALYEDMNGDKILRYFSSLGRETDWAYVERLTQQLDATLDRPLRTLSKGNRQKIGLIQAFMHKPSLLILDEPTSGLDPLIKQSFYDIVEEVRSQGKTVFVSSHDLSEVHKICDRAAFIRQGKLISIDEIKSKNTKLRLRRFVAVFNSAPKLEDFRSLVGVSQAQVAGDELSITITGNIAPFVAELAKHDPLDLREEETTLEDLFMHYYEDTDV